jgi:hypothetical protein
VTDDTVTSDAALQLFARAYNLGGLPSAPAERLREAQTTQCEAPQTPSCALALPRSIRHGSLCGSQVRPIHIGV